jgi:hypothetical protein
MDTVLFKITQNTVFKREFGTSSKSDLTFCNIEKVSNVYGIPYYRVQEDEDVGYLSHTDGPLIVEIVCNTQGRYPRLSNKPLPDGTFKICHMKRWRHSWTTTFSKRICSLREFKVTASK